MASDSFSMVAKVLCLIWSSLPWTSSGLVCVAGCCVCCCLLFVWFVVLFVWWICWVVDWFVGWWIGCWPQRPKGTWPCTLNSSEACLQPCLKNGWAPSGLPQAEPSSKTASPETPWQLCWGWPELEEEPCCTQGTSLPQQLPESAWTSQPSLLHLCTQGNLPWPAPAATKQHNQPTQPTNKHIITSNEPTKKQPINPKHE